MEKDLEKELVLLREKVQVLESLINGINNRGGIINELEAIKKEQERTTEALTKVTEMVTKNKQDYDLNTTALKSYIKGAGAIFIVAELLSLILQYAK